MSANPDIQALKVGVARSDITPPIGIKSSGFANRGPLTKLHDPLYATAVVFQLSNQHVVLISCDLLGLDAETVDEIRHDIHMTTDLPVGAITISCTHTHYGPDPYRDQENPIIKHYRANLIHNICGVVKSALLDMQPVVLHIGYGTSDIGINRREKLP
ncbi:MAG: hypothetical protein P1S60_07245, partial [Anaerolineae bacterium]|nr:hypothetical protein [Anaerolineae bacterium]